MHGQELVPVLSSVRFYCGSVFFRFQRVNLPSHMPVVVLTLNPVRQTHRGPLGSLTHVVNSTEQTTEGGTSSQRGIPATMVVCTACRENDYK
jgi:hypothetical protein